MSGEASLGSPRQWAIIASQLCATGPVAAQIKPAPAYTPQQLLAPPTTGWLTNGGTLFNQRYSPLASINRGNVAHLKAEWRLHLLDSGNNARYSGQGQPIVLDGVIYMSTGANDVFAVSVESGTILWRYSADIAWNGRKLMPSFRTALTPEQLRDVASYVSAELFPDHP
jgi:glucose dehydrogenase